MIHSNDTKQETLVERMIGASARNKFLIVIFTVFAVAAGVYGLLHTSLDAIPDLSDVQVIIYADWEGRSPDLVEDQITYPISARFISAPKVKFVRGESMFGKSFVYVIFEDGTDIYWGPLESSRIPEFCSRLIAGKRKSRHWSRRYRCWMGIRIRADRQIRESLSRRSAFVSGLDSSLCLRVRKRCFGGRISWGLRETISG